MSDCFLPINLPSKCIPYEGINPDDITIRAYQGRDAIFLAEINPVNLVQKFLLVLKNVIRGINPEDLTLGDRFYIMIWECINSYMDVVKVSTTCTHCFKEVEVSIDLKELKVTKLPDDFKQPYKVKLPSGKDIKLKLLSIKDEVELEKFEKHSDEGLLFRYAKSIVDDQDVLKWIEELRNMPAKDIATIEAFHEKFYHGPDMLAHFICPKCEREDELTIPFRLDFFFPFGRTLTDTFGKGI